MKKVFKTPEVKVIDMALIDIIATSGHAGHHGWGPDKDSDADGHDMPPGQRKINLFYETW